MSARHDPKTNACDQCFRTKQSCSKTQPECQRCLEIGTGCTYSFGKFMGKPKKSLQGRQQPQDRPEGNSSETAGLKPSDGQPELESPTVGSSSLQSQRFAQSHGAGTRNIKRLPRPTDTAAWQWEDSRTSNQLSKKRKFSEVGNVPESAPKPSARKRSNTLPACDQCYRSKVKCTRDTGRCQRCVTNKNVCTYSAVTDIGTSNQRLRHDSQNPHFAQDIENRDRTFTGETARDSQISVETTFDFLTPAPLLTPLSPVYFECATPTFESVESLLTSPNLETDPTCWLYSGLHSASPTAKFQDWPDFPFESVGDSIFAADPKDIEASKEQTTEMTEPPNSCDCLSAALSASSHLNECLKTSDGSSPDKVLSAARNGFQVCERCSTCKDCPRSIILMLCIAILHQISRCYDTIMLNTAKKQPSMSLKIGHMEFLGFSSPGIMSTILGIEKKYGASVCDGLGKLTQPIGDRMSDETWGRDSLSGLLGEFRQRFAAS